MPGRFPFRSSGPANPEIIPHSLNVSDSINHLADDGDLDMFTRTDSRTFVEQRSPTMAQFFADIEKLRSNFRGLDEDVAIFKPLVSWKGIIPIVTVSYGTGINAMFGKQYGIAIGLIFFAFGVLAVKGIAEAKNRRQSLLIFTLCLLIMLLHLIWIMRS